MSKKAVCIMSGGMDSTLAAYMMRDEGYEIVGLHFNYEQRTQTKELEAFHAICKELNVIDPYIVNLDFFSDSTDVNINRSVKRFKIASTGKCLQPVSCNNLTF